MIPVNDPLITEEDVRAVEACVRSGWISSAGPTLEAFERATADSCDRRHGVAVSSGTTALHAAVAALGIGPGDEVILPTFTIVSCALAVVDVGAVPVLVDADPETWCLDVRQVEARLTPRTRAIMPVHIYGHPADMDPLLELARDRGLRVIEDAAEAHGARYRGRPCGSFGDVSILSFYANKVITTGEGGMVLTDDDAIAERARAIRNLCFGREQRFRHEAHGNNYRLTAMQAALGLSQISRLDAVVERKRRMAERYRRRLGGLPLQLPAEAPWARSSYWMFGVVAQDVDLPARLLDRGVQTREFFLGMHEQPLFHARGLFRGESHPVAERLSRHGFYLPSGVALTEEQVDLVGEAMREALR